MSHILERDSTICDDTHPVAVPVVMGQHPRVAIESLEPGGVITLSQRTIGQLLAILQKHEDDILPGC